MVYLRIFHNSYRIARSGGKKGRIDLMDLNNKYCPYCGKNLKLIAPTYNTFPQICGKVMGGTEFCVVGELRLHSYTKCPVGKLSDLEQIKERFSKGRSVIKTFNKFGRNTKWSNPIRTVSFVKKKISNGGISLYEENLPLLCQNCNGKLAINVNPRRYAVYLYSFWTNLICLLPMAILLCVFEILAWIEIVYFLGICFLVTLFCLFGAYIWVKIIEKYRSNFAPVNQYDSLIEFQSVFSASIEVVKQCYLHETNVFETQIGEKVFHIYLVKKHFRNLFFHICASDDERKRITNMLKTKMNSCGSIILPLSFEGKSVGSVKLVEIYNFNEDDDVSNIDVNQTKFKQNWRCSECGFTNSGTSSECKFCGKYRN